MTKTSGALYECDRCGFESFVSEKDEVHAWGILTTEIFESPRVLCPECSYRAGEKKRKEEE